jgi:multidrug efflux pump subunit AcrA (membrane-fusion protein)
MRRAILILITLTITLHAKELSVAGENKMVKTIKPSQTDSVYLGSYLAIGHLSANNIYRIDAPLGGVIQKLGVHIYEPVKKSKHLLVIKSPKMLELESQYINLLIEKEYYENEVASLKPLYEAAVVAKKLYLKAENTLAKFTPQSTFYHNLLIEWGLTKEQVELINKTKKPIPEIIVESPIDGKIADLNIYPKMYVQRGEHLMTVLKSASAHLEVALPVSIAKRLKIGFELFIDNKTATVESIAATINSTTQTLNIHLIPKTAMNIIPDEKINIKLYWPKKAFSVSSSAVINYEGHESIFIKNKNGYRLINVNVIGRNNDTVYLTSKDLHKNSQVAITGVIALKGALQGQEDD